MPPRPARQTPLAASTERWRGLRLYTIGHSTRTLGELVALLHAAGVSVLADIRTIPRSRHNPQFDGEALRTSLGSRSIRYAHLAQLGGLRRARRDSPNTGWRNASFRGFADYMQTEGFERGLEELRALTGEGRVAVMCAEAVPWRCHRSLVADALTARGATVEHILGASKTSPHHLTPFAKLEGTRVRYPAETASDGGLPTQAPFHLEATVRVLQRRPENRVERWERGRYQRLLKHTDGGLVLVEAENRGTIDAPDVHFVLRAGAASDEARAETAQTLRKVLGLDLDPAPFTQLAQAHPALRATGMALRGMRPPRFADWFEAFANVVPFQQLSLDAGLAIVGRLVERFGEHLEHGGRRFDSAPVASAVAEARASALRDCGLSARKAEALRAIAGAIASGSLSEATISRLSTADALRALMDLPGIGRWSAELVLLRGLGRTDVFPTGDVGATRRLATLLQLRSEAALQHAIDQLGDHRGHLYFCALGSTLLARGLIDPAPPAPAARARGRAGR